MTIPPPVVSVIVPMYKVERYIKVCIDSILNQTFQDFEIIIVDDATPDNSYNICRELYGENPKVRIVRHKHNKGLGAARNTGIENARGEYVYFVDSDDAILPNALEILYNAAEETEADIIHVGKWYETTQDDDKPFESNQLKISDKPSLEGFVKNDLPFRFLELLKTEKILPTAWLNMCRLDFLRKNNLKFIDVISEDEIFIFDILSTAEKFFVINEPIYIYRKRPNSIMTKYDAKRFSRGVESLITVTKYIKNRMAEIPAFAENRKLQDRVLEIFLDRMNNNHVVQFYNGENVSTEIDQIIFNEFLPTFKENTAMVKYLLNLANHFHRRLITVVNQGNNIYRQAQQLHNQANILARQNQELRRSMIRGFQSLAVNPQKIVFIILTFKSSWLFLTRL